MSGRYANEDVESVIVILSVPREWIGLPEPEIARKLRGNEPHLSMMLAAEVKRWGGTGAVNLTELKRFIDEKVEGL